MSVKSGVNPAKKHSPNTTNRPTGLGHVVAPSQDTNASGIAESTISFSEFPQPPASIPSTPILSEFGFSSNQSDFSRSTPLGPRKPLSIPSASTASTYSFPPRTKASESNISGHSSQSGTSTSRPSSSRRQAAAVSPYDWHDGFSSIGMDATEDRLLSTSFITSLLKENSSSRADKRKSFSSDALSGLSEMTYPPLASSYANNIADTVGSSSSGTRLPPQKAQTTRPPPSSFTLIRESPNHLSDDSTALYGMNQDASVLRKASFTQDVQETSAVGVKFAKLQSLISDHTPSYNNNNDSSFYSDVDALLSRDNPVVATSRPSRPTTSHPQRRDSMHSTKSAISSFISRLSSQRSVGRVLSWRKAKPLPPVPLIPHIPLATELEYRWAEETASLPDLANRANTLQGYLEKGYHPHQSINSHSYRATRKGEGLTSAFDHTDTVLPEAIETTTLPVTRLRIPPEGIVPAGSTLSKKRRSFVVLGVFLIVCLAAVGTAVGITVGRKKASTSTTVCPNNFAGAACNLNATCVCTSIRPGQCDPLAQNIIDLVPSLNQLFLSNRTSNDVYKNIWLTQGSVPNDCTSQSVLVDVAPSFTLQVSENVVRWAQIALLWNIIESQNLTSNAVLQKFIQAAPWHALNTTGDGGPSLFATKESGFIFDFATQEVRQPNVSFVTVGQPTAAQLSQVGLTAQSALDRMYSFASASSIQHQKALENYWISVLQQPLSNLPTFIAALSASPVLLPFDASQTQQLKSLDSLLTPSSSAPFPPPLSCYPGLNKSQLQLINKVEGSAFALSSVSSVNHFDTACYPDRPIYGVLNVLRLRQPFLDPRSGIARQAAVLRSDVNPRVIIRNGAILSPLPGPSNVSVVAVEQSDPRQYGTLKQLNHVILQYLSSIPRVEVATALVLYILASATTQAVPPSQTSILFSSLSTIPVIEVAVFGTVSPSDISSAASAFTTSSGSLFFGSDQGTALRNWVITGCSGITIWAESPLSPLVVRDNDFSDLIFNQTWTAVSIALHNDIGNIGLMNITDTFTATNKFTPYP